MRRRQGGGSFGRACFRCENKPAAAGSPLVRYLENKRRPGAANCRGSRSHARTTDTIDPPSRGTVIRIAEIAPESDESNLTPEGARAVFAAMGNEAASTFGRGGQH